MKYKPKTKPFKHQGRATLAACRARNYAVFAEPRLGKTKIALDYVAILALKHECQRVLILSPRIAVSVWLSELHKHFPLAYMVESYDWWVPPRGNKPPQVNFWIAGREETWRAVRTNRGKLLRPKQAIIERWEPDVIILDESHQYQRPGGRGAQDAWRMVRRLRAKSRQGRPFVLLLSGTPNPRGWRSLFSQFRIMDESVFGTSVADFDEEHVIYGHGKRQYTVVGYRGEATLLKKIRRHSISISAEEAGLAGEKFWNTIDVELPTRAREAYEQMVDEFIAEVDGTVITAKNAGVLRLRLLQITGGFTTEGHALHRAKLEAVVDWLRLLGEQGEPWIVGARFIPEVDAIAAALPRDVRVGVVKGATRKTRDESVARFQRGGYDGLVFQVQAGSAAIELARAAEVVFYSFPDGWVDFKQFSDRVLGPNQKRPVRYTAILARNTLDRRVIETLQRKETWHNTLMDSPDLRGFLCDLI